MNKHSENIARMKAAGTYCDDTDPDLSFLNFRSSCKKCPNYKECKEESEKSSRAVLKFRRAVEKELKVKRR